MHGLYVLSVWLHLVAAAVWVGSMAFFALVVAPVIRSSPPEAIGPLVRALGVRFRVVGWACLVVLLATGVSNLLVRGLGWEELASRAFWGTPFGTTLAHKLVAVAAVIGSTLAHDLLFTTRAVSRLGAAPSAPDVVRRRKIASWLGRSTLILSLVVLLLAVTLVRGSPW